MTELQAGSYALMDSKYKHVGSKDGGEAYDDFGVSLTVLTTVISKHYPNKVAIDAGNKSATQPTDEVKGRPDLTVARAGAEYGALHWVQADPEPKLGDQFELITSNLDMTTNYYDRIFVCSVIRWLMCIQFWEGRGLRKDSSSSATCYSISALVECFLGARRIAHPKLFSAIGPSTQGSLEGAPPLRGPPGPPNPRPPGPPLPRLLRKRFLISSMSDSSRKPSWLASMNSKRCCIRSGSSSRVTLSSPSRSYSSRRVRNPPGPPGPRPPGPRRPPPNPGPPGPRNPGPRLPPKRPRPPPIGRPASRSVSHVTAYSWVTRLAPFFGTAKIMENHADRFGRVTAVDFKQKLARVGVGILF